VTYLKESVESNHEVVGDSCKSCNARQAINLIADKWSVLVIDAIANGNKRYSEIYRSIACVTHKMLAQTLRRLERDGLLERRIYAVVPLKTEYTLTVLGETLIDSLRMFFQWGEDHMDAITQARLTYDAEQEKDIS
jgi:DNA-binding HxlR family transcriptional regulator